VFGPERITTGAGSDIERATELARKMVCEWGMSSTMGPLTFGKREEAIFLGKEFTRHQDYSDATAVQIDDEIHRIVLEAWTSARKILEDQRAALEAIASALLEHEVLDGEDIFRLIQTHSGIDARLLKQAGAAAEPAEMA
jgi:cell division protease FtsH